MALAKITEVTGRGVFLPGDDVDTDRIIPARYLKCLTFDELGQYAFYDERAAAKREGRVHPLDDPQYKGASILLGGSNFGCGSSREHAPQSLQRFGFKAIVAESFAEIFFGNSITLGMPCVTLPEADIETLAGMIERDPQEPVTVNVAERRVTCGGREFVAHLPDTAHEALITGKWDAIADLLDGLPDVARVAAGLAYVG
jgi:3-isopropylmalate/(R)-2-methylmalate dehydratase small subunit